MKLLLGALATLGLLSACTTSHIDNPTVVTPPSISPTSTAGVAGTPPGPCDVLTTDQLRAIFGGTIAGGVLGSGSATCQWVITGSKLGRDGTIDVSYPPGQSSQAFYSAENGLLGAQKIDELGDAAFYDLQHDALTVLVGEHQFVIQATFGAKAQTADLQVDLIAAAQRVETHF